jgi:hypothetical protein
MSCGKKQLFEQRSCIGDTEKLETTPPVASGQVQKTTCLTAGRHIKKLIINKLGIGAAGGGCPIILMLAAILGTTSQLKKYDTPNTNKSL